MLDAGVVEHLHMNDLDFGVYSFVITATKTI